MEGRDMIYGGYYQGMPGNMMYGSYYQGNPGGLMGGMPNMIGGYQDSNITNLNGNITNTIMELNNRISNLEDRVKVLEQKTGSNSYQDDNSIYMI